VNASVSLSVEQVFKGQLSLKTLHCCYSGGTTSFFWESRESG